MARRDWSTSNFLRYASGVVTATPLTISAWAKTSVTSTTQHIVGLYTSGSVYNQNAFRLVVTGGDKIGANAGDSGVSGPAATSTSISANTWFHACGVYTSSTSRAAFLNGGGKGTSTANRTPSGINRTSVGVGDGSTATEPLAPSGTGDIAEVAIWNIDLTDAEVASLANGIHPFLVRPSAIVGYWPLIGRYSPEINLKSNTAVLSVQGSLSQSAHPRIFMPSNRKAPLVRVTPDGYGSIVGRSRLVESGTLGGLCR